MTNTTGPATPATDTVATDEEISLMRPIYGYGPSPAAADGMVRMLFARIAADAETIKDRDKEIEVQTQTIEGLKAIALAWERQRDEARETIRKQAEEIEQLKSNLEIAGNEYAHVIMLKILLEEELATLREQVRVLREALSVASKTFRGYASKHFLKGTDGGDLKGEENVKLFEQMEAALAATGPKG